MKEIRQHSDYYFIYKDSEVAQVTKLNKRFKSVSIDDLPDFPASLFSPFRLSRLLSLPSSLRRPPAVKKRPIPPVSSGGMGRRSS